MSLTALVTSMTGSPRPQRARRGQDGTDQDADDEERRVVRGRSRERRAVFPLEVSGASLALLLDERFDLVTHACLESIYYRIHRTRTYRHRHTRGSDPVFFPDLALCVALLLDRGSRGGSGGE
jgi:hypothetical protein